MNGKNHTKKYAEIILPLAAAGTFTYEIPGDTEGITVGSRVLVGFGRQKIYAGIVYGIHHEQPGYDTKPILDLLDAEPVVSSSSIKFWEWMAEYYMCPIGAVCDAALPAMLKIHSETMVYNIEDQLPEDIDDEELQKAFFLISSGKEILLSELQFAFNSSKAVRLVRSLAEMKVIGVRESVSEKFKPKVVRQIRLNSALAGQGQLTEKQVARSPAQKKILQYFWEHNYALSRRELKENTGVTDAVIKAMIKKGWLLEEHVRIDRLDADEIKVEPLPVLSEAQQNALVDIEKAWEVNKPVLLYGVTSSGKTEIYFQLISKVITQGKQALVLLPEIALTGQLVKRFQKVFGNKVGVYHSRIHAGQRVEIWRDVLHNNRFQVIIGPRSAIFLPYKSLGCIIVDEEHDRSYKQQDPAPRYNARDAAVVLAAMYKANLLMGSATPALESIANVKAKKYEMVKLTERFGSFSKPEIEIVDYAKWWRRHKVKAHLAPPLYDAIEQALEQKKQVILFQNRRGFSPYLQCFDCGNIPGCPHCDVRLTYHKRSNTLVCHYCGYKETNHGKCRECGSTGMRTMGFGTEKIEEELSVIFPNARISRFDQDATRKKNSHEIIIRKFEEGEIDILVGTQMVTKGLDFKNVSLVGVLNADNLFSFPDFRSFERSMQLLVQVAGRAGRHGNNGKVIIQTSQPEHAVIRYLQESNLNAFTEAELKERLQFGYPPFSRIIHITIKHKKPDVCNRAARLLAQQCREIQGAQVLGPQAPVISRIQQYFIMEVFIKMERTQKTLAIKDAVSKVIDEVKQTQGLKSVIINPDMDPY